MTKLLEYTNGNVSVELFEDGTKIRSFEGVAKPHYPETIDLKVTNWCNAPCQKWCHEQSNVKGVHGNVDRLYSLFEDAPRGLEVALGGGATQTWPPLQNFVSWLQKKGVIANMTVNQHHIEALADSLLLLFKGLGVSFQGHMPMDTILNAIDRHPHTVVHMILGVHTPAQVKAITELRPKVRILLLGYKNWGNGSRYKSVNTLAIDKCLRDWYISIGPMLRNTHLGFDNLAIEQLNLSRLFTLEGWKKFYMGDEGHFSMYIDGVKEEYASHSTSPDRVPFQSTDSLRHIFNTIRRDR